MPENNVFCLSGFSDKVFSIMSMLEHAKGRMKKKILHAKEAFDKGAGKIYFGDARIEKPLTSALEGNGTVIG